MKKLFLFAVAGFFFIANSNAQVQRDKTHQHMQSDSSHHFQRGKMMQQLNLTADQKNQMQSLRGDMQQQRSAIQNDAGLSADQKKEKMKELHKTQMQKMNAILTPDQQAKMKSFRRQGKAGHEMHRKPGQMMQQLDLTADQKTQMKTLHETMKQQSDAIKNDTSLSADQKKEKMKELRKSRMEKVNAILTPVQQAKMKELREQRRQNHKSHNTSDKKTRSEQS